MTSNINDAMRRAERVLRRHHVADERTTVRQGERSKAAIDAIIRDVQKSNAELEVA